MGKNTKELVPVLLAYGCVLVCIIGIILDIVRDKTAEIIFFLHIIMLLCWLFVSIKWTIAYRDKQNEEDNKEQTSL